MTAEELFDAVAPIAIYHRVDLRFKQKAKVGLRKLQAAGIRSAEDRLDELADWAKGEYDRLFVEIVKDLAPEWSWTHDRWGARAWKDERGLPVFAGDDHDQFPWYETAALLQERVREHQRGVPA